MSRMEADMLLDTPVKSPMEDINMDQSLSFGFLDTPSIAIPSPSKSAAALMTPKVDKSVLERFHKCTGSDPKDGCWTPGWAAAFLNTGDVERQSEKKDSNIAKETEDTSSAFVSDLTLSSSDQVSMPQQVSNLQFRDIGLWPEFDDLYMDQSTTTCHAFDDQDMRMLCELDDDVNYLASQPPTDDDEWLLPENMDKLSLNNSPARGDLLNQSGRKGFGVDMTNVNQTPLKKSKSPLKERPAATKHVLTPRPILNLLDENRQFQAWLYRKEIQRLQQVMDFILVESKFF